MADLQITIDEEHIQALLKGDQGLAALVETILNQILQSEITDHLGAEPHERSEKRRGYRNGSYLRSLTTRVGTLDLLVPRDREGTFQTELFERYQRNEKALVLTMLEMVVNGVSTRKVRRITDELCGREFSKSTVSRLTEELDEQVEVWNERSLKDNSYPFVIVDAAELRVRRQKAVRLTSMLILTGINEDGYREILGIRVANRESEQAWLETFRWLKRRGLEEVELVVSDAHEGLVSALKQCFHGAAWQRCQAHFRRNVLDATPKALRDAMHRGLDRIFKAPDPPEAQEAFEELAERLEKKAPAAIQCLEEGFEDATAVLVLPARYRRRLRTTNMLERLIEEVRRRERVIRIFPNERSAWRLVGAMLLEVHEEWITGRRYFDMEEYFEWKQRVASDELPSLPVVKINKPQPAETGIYTRTGT